VTRLREYLRPNTVDQALAAKQERGTTARYLAGGTDLVVFKPADVTCAIDITRLDLAGVHTENGALVIGATTLLRDIERHPAVAGITAGALLEALRETGPWLIRNQATLAGNLCNASPAADSAPMLLALDAELVLSDGRVIALDRFFVGPHRTILRDELVLELRLHPRDRAGSYHKQARSKSDIALVDVAVTARRENGRFTEVRVALACVAPTPIRARETEALLEGRAVDEELLSAVERSVRQEIRPIDDWRTTAAYRSHAAGVLTRRAVAALAAK